MSPAKPRLADPGALIRSGKLRTDEFRVCLDPDLIAEYERLLTARDAANEAGSDSLAGGRTVEIDAEITKALEQIELKTITLVLRALPRPKFRALVDKHPPRKNADGVITDARDRALSVNYDTISEELIRAALIEPQLDEDIMSTLFDELLTDQQWRDLMATAWNLNMASVDVPFSPAVSPSRPNSSRK